ncbi:hypothetical protein RxyAA322_19240 [Rubrobacter xylanophilus]|uniref:CBU-0592-like domain-containing protein n=1 Tax=Rubrobacter xylanophilus TaxID=49319 RepID=A0A510HJ84_9ACTN|nr:hypothetical protein RxyAA322_19240 [Rubrobacter xylanophilus]
MIQALSVVGALMILGAYAANQLRWLGPQDVSYALINAAGAGLLSFVAIVERQWGFLLLEGVWTLVSLWALLRLLGERKAGGRSPTGR